MAVNLRGNHFRFGIDSGTESTHGWYANEDVNPSHTWAFAVFLLRFNEQETGGTAAPNTDAQARYRKNGGSWTDITTTSANVKAVAAVALTNGGNCTKRLSGTGTFESTGAGQCEDGLSGGNNNDIAINGCSETEYGLQFVQADLADGDVIDFDFFSPDWTVTMDVFPSITISIPNRRGQVSWAELELPNAPRKGQVSWAEFETPDAARKGQLSWAEFELPDATTDRKGRISWAEFELPEGARRGQFSWAEFEIPDYDKSGQISWAEFETPTPPSFVLYGTPFKYESANWGTVNFYLEVYMKATTGTVYARLYNVTTNSEVPDSLLSTVLTSLIRLRSTALTLTNTHEYRIQYGKVGADAGEFLGGKLVVI